jgi:hypothetical protein
MSSSSRNGATDSATTESPSRHEAAEEPSEEPTAAAGTEVPRAGEEGKTPHRASGGEFRTGTDIGHGFVAGVTFPDKPVTFSRVDGQALFEGDIVLDGRLTEIAAAGQQPPTGLRPEATVETDDAGTVESAVVITGSQFRWANGIVPFEIDAGLPAAQQTAVQNALAHWRGRTRLAFPQRTASDPDWIRFVSGDGCSSSVGRQGGAQSITLGSGCGQGQAIHEIGHSVGLWHEQSRQDRDTFVTINWQNIDPAQRHNFDQHISDGDDVGEYDYGSIMHYPRDAFSTNGMDTIVPRQSGVTIGQRTALSAFDTAAVRSIYPGLQSPAARTWIGDFTGDGQQDLLAYVPSRTNWWLGSSGPGGTLSPRDVGNTAGFGQVGDGRPFWAGRFSRADRSEILFYFPGDDNWWLGTFNGSQLDWRLASNTHGFGHGINDGRPFWIGDFNGDGRDEVLFYYPGDDNWWMSSWNGSTFSWAFVGNTRGFGHAINDGRPFWIGDFNGNGRTDVLFYYPGDDNWWLGEYNGSQLVWSLAGNTRGFGHGINDGRPFWTGRFSRPDREQMLFYYPGDDNWWLGDYSGTLNWSLAGNTRGFGHGINDGRPFWTGDFTGDGRSDVLFYFPGDFNWWRATHNGSQLAWSLVGNTRGFGQVWDRRPFWQGRFAQRDRDNVLFYYPGDGKYWVATETGGQLGWRMFGDF